LSFNSGKLNASGFTAAAIVDQKKHEKSKAQLKGKGKRYKGADQEEVSDSSEKSDLDDEGVEIE
jgi:hypothetical protein